MRTTDAVVVASHGFDEEQALVDAVKAGIPYVGLVASPKRGSAVIAAGRSAARTSGSGSGPGANSASARSPGAGRRCC